MFEYLVLLSQPFKDWLLQSKFVGREMLTSEITPNLLLFATVWIPAPESVTLYIGILLLGLSVAAPISFIVGVHIFLFHWHELLFHTKLAMKPSWCCYILSKIVNSMNNISIISTLFSEPWPIPAWSIFYPDVVS